MRGVRKSFHRLSLAMSVLWLLFARTGPFEAMAPDDFPIRNIVTGLTYAVLQDAINANETLDGHTITVDAGIYNVSAFVINKSVSVVGEGRETTILRGSVSYEFIGIFSVSADNVTIAGFTIQDGYWGIHLYSNYVHIANCTVRNNRSGIVSGPRAGAFGGNTIEGSIIADNVIVGIDLMTSNNIIYNNIISGNRVGINVVSTQDKTSGTVISGNTIKNNQIGCQIAISYNNVVFHNNFLNNTIQASSPTGDINEWDDGYPSEGNYWSDYNGTDADHDGIGDSPYVISTSDQDHYPLMAEYVIPEYPMGLIIAFFTMALLLAVAVWKKKESDLAIRIRL